MIIWFATGNIHKKEELSSILGSGRELKIPWELKIPKEAGIDFDPDEKGNSFLENALIKAAELYRLLEEHAPRGADAGVAGHAVIADDSGLCVDALNGRPGIYSARYGGGRLDAAEKNALLLAELGDNPLRKARFICAMVLYCGPNRFYAVQESMEGELVKNSGDARGKGGFGYDPILYIPESGCTVAELPGEEKNRLSHRGKAGRVIAGLLDELAAQGR